MLHIRLKFQVDPITNRKLPFLPMFVCLVFHPLLSSDNIVFNQEGHLLPFFKPLLQIGHSTLGYVTNPKVPWGMTIQYLKWCLAMG